MKIQDYWSGWDYGFVLDGLVIYGVLYLFLYNYYIRHIFGMGITNFYLSYIMVRLIYNGFGRYIIKA